MYDDFLCCPLCQEALRSPKLLTCLHTFCSDCLIAYVDRVTSRETASDLTDAQSSPDLKPISGNRYGFKGISCPVCEVVSYKNRKIDEVFVESLPDNDFISGLLKAVDSCPPAQLSCTLCTGSASCSSAGSVNSDVNQASTEIDSAEDGGSNKSGAVAWCFDCKEGLCEQCRDKHVQCPATRKHSPVDISRVLEVSLEKRRQVQTRCLIHPDECVKYYCVNCRVLGCMECTVLNHKKHYCVSTKEAIKLYRPELEGLKKKLRHYHNDMHEIKNAIPSYLEKAGQRCERDINDYFDKLVDMLRKKQSELLTELKQIRDVEDTKALQSADLSDKFCRTAQRMYAMLRYLLKYGSETELLLHYENIRKHDIMQQIIRQQDEKLARYTFYSGNIEQSLEASLETGQSLDVSYFRGDFVPKALRLCKNTSEKITMKCELNSNGKRARTRLLLDDGEDFETKPKSLTKMNSRSQSVSNIAILASLSDRRNSDASTSDDIGLENQFQTESKENFVISNLASPATWSMSHKNQSPRQPPTRDKDLERRLKHRKVEKPQNSSNLQSSMGLSKSVTDISLLLGSSKDGLSVPSSVKSEVVKRAKRSLRPRPRSTIDSSGHVIPESKEISNAFERLRRLANMDNQSPERKLAPDRTAARLKRMSLYRPASQRAGSVENVSRAQTDVSPDSPSDSLLRSPTVMAVHGFDQDEEKPSRRHLYLEQLDGEMDFSFEEELESALENIGDSGQDEGKDTSSEIQTSLETSTNREELDDKHTDFEIPIRLSTDPLIVFNCRDTGAHDAAPSHDDDGRYPAGVVCLADGNMVVADAADNSVKLFTSTGIFLDTFCLHGKDPEPRDITGTTDDQVAVLYHERQLIAFLSTKNKLFLEKTVATSKGYVAISGYDEFRLVVTCVFPSSIDIIQMDGTIERSIDLFKMVPMADKPLFLQPWYISCSDRGEIIVSENSQKFVLAVTKNFSPKFVYKSEDDSLRSARGVCVVVHGNVLLVDEVSGNIRVISSLGSFLGYAFPDGFRLDNPLNVAYGSDHSVVVLQKNGDVKVYKIEDSASDPVIDCWELKI
ncbi:uncharacterized protein LOC135473693 [Liolophura sinensis]|uniref:uncharacterized protein LOC135473693 n=1 Tax=Liolophura sinensis TaxID=3198878 RepID=UPI00315872BE